jgi:hypothetical protein
MLIGTKLNEAGEAIKFALRRDVTEGLEFLRAWYGGNSDALKEWPEWIAHVETLEDDPELMCERCGKFSGYDQELCDDCAEDDESEDHETCRSCQAEYEDGGDGYDGNCPSCADRAEERGAEKAARALGWTRDGDGDGIIFNTNHYESWKAAVSWAPRDGATYETWMDCCDSESIEYGPADPEEANNG